MADPVIKSKTQSRVQQTEIILPPNAQVGARAGANAGIGGQFKVKGYVLYNQDTSKQGITKIRFETNLQGEASIEAGVGANVVTGLIAGDGPTIISSFIREALRQKTAPAPTGRPSLPQSCFNCHTHGVRVFVPAPN